MNDLSIFEHLAIAAVYTGKAMAVTYRVEVNDRPAWRTRQNPGRVGVWVAAGDEQHSFDDAYDDYVEAHKNYPHEDIIVWEISADGMATDITERMVYEAESIAEQRGRSVEWIEETEAGGESDHEHQRSAAIIAGHFS